VINRWQRTLVAAVLASAVTTGTVGCVDRSGGPESGDVPNASIHISAAASLTDVFTVIAEQFELHNPNTRLSTSFGSSSTIVDQVINGAPVTALATASEATMNDAVKAHVIAGTPQVFALNQLAIVVPAGNPANIESIADLGRTQVKLAICQPQVPCGQAARELFTRARVPLVPVTFESDVRAVLAKAASGEVDAGIVYRSDVIAGGTAVASIPIPDSINVSTRYPIAAIANSEGQLVVGKFIDFLLSPGAQLVLADHGFTPITAKSR